MLLICLQKELALLSIKVFLVLLGRILSLLERASISEIRHY